MQDKLCVLVTDDWPDAAESLARLLRLRGHTVHVAFDGNAAIEKAKQNQPDVILLDIKMPKLTGLDVARILSEIDGKRPMLIAISGSCTSEDKQKAHDVGFEHFFPKPMDIGALLRVLDEARTQRPKLGRPDNVA